LANDLYPGEMSSRNCGNSIPGWFGLAFFSHAETPVE
jgi:hypothetical protein